MNYVNIGIDNTYSGLSPEWHRAIILINTTYYYIYSYSKLNIHEWTSVKIETQYKSFIEENTFENAFCKIADILSQGQWVI